MKDWAGNAALNASELKVLMLKKLSESGLDEADARRLGMEPLTAAQCAARGHWSGAKPHAAGFALPYHDPWTGAPMTNADGSPSVRARCLTDSKYPATDKKPRRFDKYTQSFGSLPHAYFPALTDWPSVLTEPRALIITEGELKAACATKRGFPTIGLGGVWSFMSKKHRFVGFLPELERVVWEGRRVMIAFDSDVTEKPDVQRAMAALTARLVHRGALPHCVSIPGDGDRKVGLDDFIIAHGTDAFKKLLMDAAPLESWQSFYQIESNGKPINNASNAMVAVSLAPELQDTFAFDMMATTVAVVAPVLDSERENFRRRSISDDDADAVRLWLQREGGLLQIGKDDVSVAINARAHERPFHPVRDWLRSLTWDGKPRLNRWLADYMSATDNPQYLARVGSMFLISMVARVEEPGCKVDHALMWIGEQGISKSMACQILAGEWFSDQLPHLDKADEKRLSMHLRGKWLIEIAEFGAMKKADIEDVKKFLTRQTEKYLPSYGRHEAVEHRQCVFIVTTNEDYPLRDETSNRRWWPASVGEVRVDALRRDRDQLMAEAFVRYQAGEKWHAEREEERALIKPEQDKRFEGDEWDEALRKYLEDNLKLALTGGRQNLLDYRVTSNFLALNALGFEVKHVTNFVCKRISNSLKRLGWKPLRSHGITHFVPSEEVLKTVVVEIPPNVVPIKPRGKKY